MQAEMDTVQLVSQALSEWRTIPEVREFVFAKGGPYMSETGTSARIRDLRKSQFGAQVVKAQVRQRGLWEYRLDRTN